MFDAVSQHRPLRTLAAAMFLDRQRKVIQQEEFQLVGAVAELQVVELDC